MKILRLNGTPYENGKISGRFFKKAIKKDIPFYENLLNKLEIKQLSNSLLLKLKDKYPNYYEEIKGKADGAGVNFQAYFLMMCPELLKKSTTVPQSLAKTKMENLFFRIMKMIITIKIIFVLVKFILKMAGLRLMIYIICRMGMAIRGTVLE